MKQRLIFWAVVVIAAVLAAAIAVGIWVMMHFSHSAAANPPAAKFFAEEFSQDFSAKNLSPTTGAPTHDLFARTYRKRTGAGD